MSYVTAEVKLRTLAAADATLQGFFGTGPFRWFDVQEAPKYIEQGPCVRVMRVSTVRDYLQGGISQLSCPRFQIDVLDYSAENSRQAAQAIIDWLSRISLAENNQFASPQTTPPQFPNFLLNQRSGMEPQTKLPVFVTMLDVRLFNLEQ
jgi:hypothetical protein